MEITNIIKIISRYCFIKNISFTTVKTMLSLIQCRYAERKSSKCIYACISNRFGSACGSKKGSAARVVCSSCHKRYKNPLSTCCFQQIKLYKIAKTICTEHKNHNMLTQPHTPLHPFTQPDGGLSFSPD